MKDFKKLKIWQNGIIIVTKIYKLTEYLPSTEKYGLISQITRAAVSVPSNIAEGSGRSSEKEYIRFLEFALGSTYEIETQLLIILNLNLVEEQKIEIIMSLISEEQKMISGFINKLNN